MPSYKKIVISFFFTVILCSNINAAKIYEYEDRDILFAIEYENLNDYLRAKNTYLRLFENTKNSEYLLKYLRISLFRSEFKDAKKFSLKYLDKKSSDYEQVLRVYIISLINLKEFNTALKYSKDLLKENKSSLNYEIVANVYFAKREFLNAVKYFESAYIENNSSEVLFNLVNILYAYAGQKQKAISYLETHIRLFGDDYLISSKLLSIYQEQNNLNGIISVLKRMYRTLEDNENYSKKRTFQLLVSYLEKKDLKLAIEFLEKEDSDDKKLFNLYKRNHNFKKALKLANKIYKKESNIDYLAQIAILEFELAKNKKRVLSSVIKKFEDVLSVLNNHIYQNYLGYILIEYTSDAKKGLTYINKALEQAPNNIAYLDSLAWGEYKLGNCKLAKKYMQKVIDVAGLDDYDIKKHWNKIKECAKK